MSEFRFSVLAISLLLGSAAAAAPPAPPPTAFTPEVIYRYNGNRAVDLRLANATGTAAVLLHRAPGLTGYDLAPASQRTAAFIETSGPTDRLMVRSWTYDTAGAIVVGPARTLHEAVNLLFSDFSPTGDRIAFDDWDGTGNFYTIKTVDLATGVVATIAPGVDGPFYLRWSTGGDALYYARQITVGGVTRFHAFRQPISGGAPTEIFSEPNIEAWDISRDGTDGLVFPFSRPGFSTISIGTWNGATVNSLPAPSTGSQPHYSCGNDRLIYRYFSKNGIAGPVKVHTFATGSDVVFSKDQNVPHADFIACG